MKLDIRVVSRPFGWICCNGECYLDYVDTTRVCSTVELIQHFCKPKKHPNFKTLIWFAVAGKANLASEALAGLASKENFGKVGGRKRSCDMLMRYKWTFRGKDAALSCSVSGCRGLELAVGHSENISCWNKVSCRHESKILPCRDLLIWSWRRCGSRS